MQKLIKTTKKSAVMLQKIKQFKVLHPFTSLMLFAIAIRLLAIVFVPGFGYCKGSFFHLGDSPWVMLLCRTAFATVSLFTVSMVYRICDLLSDNRDAAWNIALIPSICVILPSLGIINDVHFFVGLPVLLYGCNILLRQQVLRKANMNQNVHRSSYIIAGLMLGLAICLWYQCAFVVLAILLMLCIKRDFKGILMTLIGIAVSLVFVWVILLIFNINPWNLIRQ